MSRSYRHHTYLKDRNPWMKKHFNRKIRRSNQERFSDIPNGGFYKKLNCSWEISDFTFGYWDWEEFKHYNQKWYESEDEMWNDWRRNYYYK